MKKTRLYLRHKEEVASVKAAIDVTVPGPGEIPSTGAVVVVAQNATGEAGEEK